MTFLIAEFCEFLIFFQCLGCLLPCWFALGEPLGYFSECRCTDFRTFATDY